MKVDGRHGFVCVEDIGQYLRVLVAGGALVVNDDIITFGPVSILEEIEGGVNGLVRSPDDVNTDIGAALQAFGDDFVLLSVIVAATAGDQQSFQGFAPVRRDEAGLLCLAVPRYDGQSNEQVAGKR